MTNNIYYNEDQKGKLEQWLRVSNPEKVIENAKHYFNDPNIKVFLSTSKNSKYAIYDPINKKLVHFGNIDYYDYTKHQDPTRRENYLKQALNIKGNWRDNPYSPNNMAVTQAVNLLWNWNKKNLI